VARIGWGPVVATRYVIDTHALLWYLANDPALGARVGAVLDDPTSDLVLPVIAFAEACFIIERRKVRVGLPELLAAIDSDTRFTVMPLDRVIVFIQIALPNRWSRPPGALAPQSTRDWAGRVSRRPLSEPCVRFSLTRLSIQPSPGR
jgi:PIN domain nuclease of toxin-antitoxin system